MYMRTHGELEEKSLCEHIIILGEFESDVPSWADCEYIVTVKLKCKVCAETHEIDILVN